MPSTIACGYDIIAARLRQDLPLEKIGRHHPSVGSKLDRNVAFLVCGLYNCTLLPFVFATHGYDVFAVAEFLRDLIYGLIIILVQYSSREVQGRREVEKKVWYRKTGSYISLWTDSEFSLPAAHSNMLA